MRPFVIFGLYVGTHDEIQDFDGNSSFDVPGAHMHHTHIK
jgi:hypothetical protein